MNPAFTTPIDRRASESLKWGLFDADVLPLWVADMDFPAPAPVLEALRERIGHGVLGYPLSTASPEAGFEAYRELLVARMASRYGWAILPEEIVFVPGVVVGFTLACHTFGEPGDGVLIQPPVYMPFLSAPGLAGRQRQDAPLALRPDGSYEIDWEVFEGAITNRTKLFLLCNPHNPAGRVWRRDELARMAEICLRRGVVMCSDEIHCDLVFEPHTHVPLASLSPEVARRAITLMAPSKTFNIAGLTSSFAIIQDPGLRRAYLKARQGLVAWVNLLGMVAAEAAYRHGQPWLDDLLATLDGNRRFLADTLARDLPGLRMALPEATYLAWLDCRGAGLPDSPGKFFLEKARVALNDGADFGPGGEGFVRLNFGCHREVLAEALKRMASALA